MTKLRNLSFPTRIFLLAFVLRLVPVLLAINLPIGLDDMFQYDMLGRSIAEGKGYTWYAEEDLARFEDVVDFDFIAEDYNPEGIPASFRPPAYPTFLALIYSISGFARRLFATRLVQAALGATLAPMTWALGRCLFPEHTKAATWASYAIALYPMLLIYPLALATEVLFIPLVLASLLLLLRAANSGRDRDYLLAGLTLGAATLTRSVIFAFVGLAILWVWFAIHQRRGAILLALSAMLVITPWVVRNSLLHDELTFVETSLGYNLHMGYHPEGSGTFQYGISLELIPYLDDGVRDDLGMQMGLDFIRQDPGRVLPLALNRLGYFFALERRALTYFYSNGYFGSIPGPLLGMLFLIFMLPFVLITGLGAFALPFFRWNKSLLLMLLFFGGYLLPHVLILAEPRFHLTLVPALAVLAGYAWTQRAALWAQAKQQRPKMLLALALVALLFLNWGLELWRDVDKLALLFGPEGYQSYFPY